MEKVGVEAVVEGLSAFIRDTGRMNSALDKIRPQGTLLMRAFSGITDALGSFGREVLNVAEYALGHLLADAIEFVVQKFKELLDAVVQAGSEFQTLSLRLGRLNFNTAIESGLGYTQAMQEATRATQEQLEWIRVLAVQTPYDAQDIANVFTLARSYGFAADQAQGLTRDISDFAAGMGLGSTEIERIIVNFGQMVQQGKVTQREMNDLARGSFVPVNDILRRMQQNVGMTDAEFQKFRYTGEGVNAFMEAFSQIVRERFQGASDQMARTWEGATANLQDFFKSILGFEVVMPILDTLGTRIANALAELTKPENFQAISDSARRFGLAVSRLISDIFGGEEINADTLVEGIVTAFNKLTTWINTNGPKIVKFFREDIPNAIRTKILPIVEKIREAFDTIRQWVADNGPRIKEFFNALGTIVSKVFQEFFGGGAGVGVKGESPLEGLLRGVSTFMQFIIDNQDVIAEWAAKLLKAFVIFQVVMTVLTVVGGIVVGVIGFFLGLAAAIAGVVSVISAVITALSVPFVAVVAIVVAAIGFVISMFVLFGAIIYASRDKIIEFVNNAIIWFETFRMTVETKINEFVQMIQAQFAIFTAFVSTKLIEFVSTVRTKFTEFVGVVQEKISQFHDAIKNAIEGVKMAFREAPWGTIGRNIIEGITGGVMKAAGALAAAAARAVTNAINAARAAAGISSPSREGIYIGEMTMAGIAKGIEEGAQNAMRSMEGAVKMLATPALALPAITQQYAVAMPPGVSNTNSYTNNFNLTVNSGAPVEPILQDYNMMQSLIQG